MLKVKPNIVLVLAASVVLSACASGTGMMNLRSSGTGPDEFSILPTKELDRPKSYAELPEPTPGGTNLVDPTPIADATVALGGRASNLNRAGIPRGDQGVVTAASRYGVSSNIRDVLATEDNEFRQNNRGKLLERMLKVTVYFGAYEPQTLDRYAELKRLRKAGVRTPAAPPSGTE